MSLFVIDLTLIMKRAPLFGVNPRGGRGTDLLTLACWVGAHRLMSDYEVTLVNDNMQEFYVRFHGPVESTFGQCPFN